MGGWGYLGIVTSPQSEGDSGLPMHLPVAGARGDPQQEDVRMGLGQLRGQARLHSCQSGPEAHGAGGFQQAGSQSLVETPEGLVKGSRTLGGGGRGRKWAKCTGMLCRDSRQGPGCMAASGSSGGPKAWSSGSQQPPEGLAGGWKSSVEWSESAGEAASHARGCASAPGAV